MPPTRRPSTVSRCPSTKTAAAAAPSARPTFDLWNSSSTGHQHADNRLSGSTAWRDSRSLKLGAQFRGGPGGGPGGGERVADTVGAGSVGFGRDGRKENGGWVRGASGLRGRGQRSIVEAMGAGVVKSGVREGGKDVAAEEEDGLRVKEERRATGSGGGGGGEEDGPQKVDAGEALGRDEADDHTYKQQQPSKQIFQHLCIYINGSTAPFISDHKLKHLLASHGAKLSIALGRRSVTHVILGTTAANGGAGGGLAATKIQKEIARVGGRGVKFVGAEWVVESIRAGKRLPEAQFSNLKLAAKGQKSVLGMFKTAGPERDTASDAG